MAVQNRPEYSFAARKVMRAHRAGCAHYLCVENVGIFRRKCVKNLQKTLEKESVSEYNRTINFNGN